MRNAFVSVFATARLVDVDRADVRGAVERELDAEDARAAADVEAALVRADALAEEVAPDHEARLARRRDAGVDGEVGERQRVQAALAAVGPRRGRPATAATPLPPASRSSSAAAAAVAGLRALEALARGGDVLGPRAAAAADDLRALLAPGERHAARTRRRRRRGRSASPRR